MGLSLDFVTNERMNDVLQRLASIRLGEHVLAHALPVKRAARGEKSRAESTFYRRHRQATRFRGAAGDGVGIDHVSSPRLQQARHRALAAANAASEAEPRGRFHRPMVARMAEGPKTMDVRPANARKGPKGT